MRVLVQKKRKKFACVRVGQQQPSSHVSVLLLMLGVVARYPSWLEGQQRLLLRKISEPIYKRPRLIRTKNPPLCLALLQRIQIFENGILRLDLAQLRNLKNSAGSKALLELFNRAELLLKTADLLGVGVLGLVAS